MDRYILGMQFSRIKKEKLQFLYYIMIHNRRKKFLIMHLEESARI